MLENIVAWVLNNYIGEYLENLNTDQLSIALLQGQVELENVPFKKTALRKFDVPLQVKSGLLGKLTLSVPLTRMRSEPWVLKMSDLLLLLEPAYAGRHDVEAVEVYEQSKKEQQLEELEKYHKRQLMFNAGLPSKNESAEQNWWGASLVSAVVNNIQLILTNVHIRYEDGTTIPDGTPFACGIRVHNVSVQTTNSQWKPGFMQPQDGVNAFKKLELEGLSVYWNCDQKVTGVFESIKDLQDFLAPEVSKDNTYVLQPFSAHLFMEKNTSKFPLKSYPVIPRFKFDLRPEKVNIELSKRQLAEIQLLGREWARYERARQHRKWRPLVSVGGNAKEWWNFAFNRVQEETSKKSMRRSWRFALSRARHLNAYCRAYRRKLLSFLETLEKERKENSAATPTGQNSLSTKLESNSSLSDQSSMNSATQSFATIPAVATIHPCSSSEDLILMKQIERDPEYTYHELQLFREMVFRRLVAERETDRRASESGIHSEDEMFEALSPLVTPDDSQTDLLLRSNEGLTTTKEEERSAPQSGGVYSWLTSWFTSSEQKDSKDDEQVLKNVGNELDMLGGEIKESNLPPYLKQLEKQLEDEILDVLNESWDDSTLLRRDSLLAEIVLQLEQMTVRFIDDSDFLVCGSARVLAMDLWHVISRVQISPRQHTTGISLSVGDMSVQRLCAAPDDERSSAEVPVEATGQADDSLMFGFGAGNAVKETTHILFAIGKARTAGDDLAGPSAADSASGKNMLRKPIFQMMYRRRAPKMLAKHTVSAKFSELSVMYDEGAFDDIGNLFNTEAIVFEKKSPVPQIEQTSQLFMTVRVPEVRMELRSKRNGLLGERRKSQTGTPFAIATVKQLTVNVENVEPYITKISLAVEYADVKDLFESTNDSLIRTVSQFGSLSGSRSCPNLSSDLSDVDSTQVNRTGSFGSLAHSSNSCTGNGPEPSLRKTSGVFGLPQVHRKVGAETSRDGFGSAQTDQSVISVILVSSRHPLFDSIYKKASCVIDAQLTSISLGMNRRSWTLMFDFFGLLGRAPDELAGVLPEFSDQEIIIAPSESETDLSKYGSSDGPYGLKVNISSPCIRVNMNYPTNKTQLGVMVLRDCSVSLQMIVGDREEPLEVSTSFGALNLSDNTPFYSEIYKERLTLQSKVAESPVDDDKIVCISTPSSSKATIEITKHSPADSEMKRPWDMRVEFRVPSDMTFAYAHTHRYMCALIDFWVQFFELQDQLIKSNKLNNEIVADAHKSRILLDVDIPCSSCLILPLNQFSDQVIVGEMSRIRITNQFKFAESISDLGQHCIENQYGNDDDKFDCLLDWTTIQCSDLALYEGDRIANTSAPLAEVSGFKRVCQNIFDGYHFLCSRTNVLSRLYDLHVDVFRNLDGAFSHKVPDMAVVTDLSEVGIRFTTDFYCLLRGFLERNLGDPLVPVPEAIPIEILQKPVDSCEVGSSNKYATFALRMTFKDVQFNCFVPSGVSSPSFVPFACVKLNRSRISFDIFIDNQSELDLICESTELHDSRFDYLEQNNRPNVFSTILCPRTKNDENSGQLMSEAHLMLKKDEPPVLTLVLLNARVLLILDWLNDAKNFVLLNTNFVPPVENASKAPSSLGSAMKSGVVHRIGIDSAESVQISEQTITLKITLKESDLVLLETPNSPDSLALLAHTTAVLNMSDPRGVLNGNLEIQRMSIGWCVMSAEQESCCQLTNDFSTTISLSSEAYLAEVARASGLPSLSLPKHHVNMELNDIVARVSYRDTLVISSVLESSLKRLAKSLEKSAIPSNEPKAGKKGGFELNIIRTVVKSDRILFWLLDDFQGTAFPLVRFILTKASVERQLERISASFIVAVQYFNQRVFGWEPLLEPWHVQHFIVWMKGHTATIELHSGEESTFDLNITQVFVQQALHFHSKWPQIKQSLDTNFRSTCIRSRSDHLPYLLRNETGSDLRFTTEVEEILDSRAKQRRSTAKWHNVPANNSCTFEFPTKRLVMMEYSDDPKQLIIRVDGWDEVSPVNVDSVGTYFRSARYSTGRTSANVTKSKSFEGSLASLNARLVVAVSMDKDGRKVVVIRSALTVVNQLPNAVLLFLDNQNRSLIDGSAILRVDAKQALSIPLKFANAQISVKPDSINAARAVKIDWHDAKVAGEVMNKTLKFDCLQHDAPHYWICASVKREHYPEYEILPGHTITLMPPLTILSLLPIDAELAISGKMYAVAAGKQLQVTVVDISRDISFRIVTDRFESSKSILITKSVLAQKPNSSDAHRLDIEMKDSEGRRLDMYGSVNVGRGGAVSLSLWVPYWIVNKAGIPLIIKQEATDGIAAGQLEEHERAKDRHPLMFSFADENCPKQCAIRVGNKFTSDPGYKPVFSHKFYLTTGVHSLKLLLTHIHQPTLIYNIGVDVRQGTGRYKDTQVVLLMPRYLLNNQTSYGLSLSHVDFIDQPNQHVKMASKCSLVWNENFEDKRMLCVKRHDVKYWSCPFRIDQISSFHVTMRDEYEKPQFVRVEVILSSAVFCVTFTDARYFPPPIQLENLSDVPVLYHQKTDRPEKSHLRTICKANSTVDYAWDDHYANKLLTLQVFENKSNSYDPQKPGMGPSLVYDNDVYIKLTRSFARRSVRGFTDENELVMQVMQKGKVMLNKLNVSDSSRSQLWRFARDGCLENIGMNNRARPGERYVLDVLDRAGNVLMMLKRNTAREKYQKWHFTQDKRLRCGVNGMYVEARQTEVLLAPPNKNSGINEEGVPLDQMWEMQTQRPGSGILDVECFHRGPTLVVRITDRGKILEGVTASTAKSGTSRSQENGDAEGRCWDLEMNVTMRSGIGISVINGQHEELIYARFQGIGLHANRRGKTYQLTGSVELVQIDNELLSTEHWQVLYCKHNALTVESPPVDHYTTPPALKLEMNCTPMEHYDAFDCFRLRLCDMSVQLDETLLWKMVQFVQESEAADSMQPSALLRPPNTELERPDPTKARKCYFGTLDLEMGSVALSVTTIAKSGLPPELRKLRRQFNMKLVSFENAMISLPPFRQFRYFETFSFLLETLSKFYLGHLKSQTFNIIVTMDAFGNPSGLAADVKESFEGLVFEGDLSGFVGGLGYGITNSISKVASSVAHGVGTLTFDEQHELMRRRMLRCQPQSDSSSALAHLYSGVKGLGVGVFGGLTAIVTNTYTESKRDGFTGALRGITTGAVDTVTKPVQGIFDLVEGTASAMKEIVGGPPTRKSHFAENRIRLPRVCSNLQSLLPPYSEELAIAQMDLLRINGFSTNEVLLDVEKLLDQTSGEERVRQHALICSEQCYVIRQVDNEPSNVVQRIPYKHLKLMHPVLVGDYNSSFASIEITLELSNGKRQTLPHLWCSRLEIAKRLCEKVVRAKQLYDHSKRTLTVAEDYDII